MKRTKRTAMTVAALSALAGGAGCSNFEDETTVIDLRVLGLAAQPPEIYVDQSTLDSRTDPFTSDITALVVDPKGAGRPVSYSVLACPREIDAVTAATGRNGVVCQPNVSGMPPNSLEVTSGETTDPGPVHEIPFTFQVPPELLKLAFSVDLPAGSQGFQLPIVLQMQLGAGTESVTATKRVIFSQPIPDHEDQPANANPVITQVMTYTDRDADANPVDPKELPAAGPPLMVALGSTVWFEPDGAVAEHYFTRELTRDNPPQVVTKEVAAETLRYAFFTTAGSFAPPQTSTQPPLIFNPTDRIHVESHYTAPSKMPDTGPDVTVWILARDERGGASWVQRAVTLVP